MVFICISTVAKLPSRAPKRATCNSSFGTFSWFSEAQFLLSIKKVTSMSELPIVRNKMHRRTQEAIPHYVKVVVQVSKVSSHEGIGCFACPFCRGFIQVPQILRRIFGFITSGARIHSGSKTFCVEDPSECRYSTSSYPICWLHDNCSRYQEKIKKLNLQELASFQARAHRGIGKEETI